MSNHTPGPWHVENEETWPADAPCFITAHPGGPLCIVDSREDAHLIAAAPEMLEQVIEIYNSIEFGGRIVSFSDEDIERMGELVAKARGEE